MQARATTEAAGRTLQPQPDDPQPEVDCGLLDRMYRALELQAAAALPLRIARRQGSARWRFIGNRKRPPRLIRTINHIGGRRRTAATSSGQTMARKDLRHIATSSSRCSSNK